MNDECLCLYSNRAKRILSCTVAMPDGTMWDLFEPCPVDGNPVVEMVWSPLAEQTKTTTDQVVVGMED